MTKIVLVGSAFALLAAGSARGDGPKSLTFGDVVELARTSSPAVRLADADVDIVRGRRAGARVLVADNPVLSGGLGRRWGDDSTTDREVSLSIPIELGGKRSKRTAAVDADVRVVKERALDVRRYAVGGAAAAYFDVLFARDMVALAEERETLAEKLVAIARDRKEAGDAAAFEISLADGELSRARSGVAAAERQLARARTRLAMSVGLGSMDGVTFSGQLDDWSFVSLDGSEVEIDERTDVRVARARVSAASADIELADTLRWPALSFQVTYAHEESADIAFGGIALTIPIFERGQGDRAVARADRHRAELELDVTERAASAELEGARDAYVSAIAAADEMQQRALPLAIKNERMARESYAAGKIGLAAMLVVRREALDTRAEHLDRLSEAARAAVDLWVAQGAAETTKEK